MIEKTCGENIMSIALHVTYLYVQRPICPIDLIFVLISFVLQPTAAIGMNMA